jgi:hypothetical protein
VLARLASLLAAIHAGDGPTRSHGTVQWAVVGDALLFAGSNSLADWAHNLRAWPAQSPTGPGTVHAGWLALARSAWPAIKADLPPGRAIKRVAGYSQGGAIALLVAEVLQGVDVVVFAGPAVGCREWARRYPHGVVRCTVEPDWLAQSLLGRVHVGGHVAKSGGHNGICNHLNTLALWSADRS